MITIDTKRFDQALLMLSREVPEEFDRIMSWQMSLILQRMIKKIHTQPSLGLAAQKRLHEGRVEDDINRLFAAPKKGFKLSSIKRTGEYILKKDGAEHFFVAPTHFLGNNISAMARIHAKNRNRKGQVARGVGGFYRDNNKPYSAKYWVSSQATLNKYRKEMMRHVGRTKSAWVASLEYFQRRSDNFSTWEPPLWVRRNRSFGDKYASQMAQISKGAMEGHWQAVSNVPWVTQRDARGVAQWSLDVAAREMSRGQAAMRLQKIFAQRSAKGAA